MGLRVRETHFLEKIVMVVAQLIRVNETSTTSFSANIFFTLNCMYSCLLILILKALKMAKLLLYINISPPQGFKLHFKVLLREYGIIRSMLEEMWNLKYFLNCQSYIMFPL